MVVIKMMLALMSFILVAFKWYEDLEQFHVSVKLQLFTQDF